MKPRTRNIVKELQNTKYGFKRIDEVGGFVLKTIAKKLVGRTIESHCKWWRGERYYAYTFPNLAFFVCVHDNLTSDYRIINRKNQVKEFLKINRASDVFYFYEVSQFGEDKMLLSYELCNGSRAVILDLRTDEDKSILTYSLDSTYIPHCLAGNGQTFEAAFGCYNDLLKVDMLQSSTKGPKPVFNFQDDSPYSLQFHEKSNLLYAGTDKGYIYGFNEELADPVFRQRVSSRRLNYFRIVNDGTSLVLSFSGSVMQLFDLRMRRTVMDYEETPSDIRCTDKIPFAVDELGFTICSAAFDSHVRIWDLRSGLLLRDIHDLPGRKKSTCPLVHAAAFTKQNGHFLTSPSLVIVDDYSNFWEYSFSKNV